MKVGVMQPYFLPYLGYWQLMNHVDIFVVYDNIQFTRKGWINRNRLLQNGKPEYFSLPLKKDSDYLDVRDRRLSDVADQELDKLSRRIEGNYRKAPGFNSVSPLVEKILEFDSKNLFEFIFNSLTVVKEHLSIDTELVVSSSLDIDHDLKSQDKVLALAECLGATEYINPMGGLELYDKTAFADNGIKLGFLQAELKPYIQYKNDFIPGLSILDVLMFNSKEMVGEYIKTDYSIN